MTGGPIRSDHFVVVVPGTRSLRAAGVWITIANWAAGFKEHGEVSVLLPGRRLDSDEVWAIADDLATAEPAARHRRVGGLEVEARTLLKDVRALAQHSAVDYSSPTQEAISRHGPPTVVWQHHDPWLDVGRQLRADFGCPVVQFVDAPHVWEARRWGVQRPLHGRWLEKRAERPQLALADLVVAVSQEVADAVTALGVPATRVVVLPCTVLDARFVSAGSVPRASLGFAESDVVFGWVGSFRPFHGVELALEAFQGVRQQREDARLLLVGDGPTARAMREKVRALELASSVVFTGSVPPSAVPALLKTVDVGVVTSRAGDGFHYSPLKLWEYMAAETTPVVPALPAMAGLPRDAVVFYRAGSALDLASAMISLAEQPGRRRRIARQAHRYLASLGGPSQQVEGVLERLARGARP